MTTLASSQPTTSAPLADTDQRTAALDARHRCRIRLPQIPVPATMGAGRGVSLPTSPRHPEADVADAGLSRPPTLRDFAHLYDIADDLTARCQTGEAARVLDEVDAPLREAEEAGAAEIINRLRYVVALGNLQLGHLDEVVAACDKIIDELTDQGDAAWLSSAHSLRGIALQFRGDHLAAVNALVDAAVLLDEARPTGQPYIYAVNGLAVGYQGLRLYELALDEYGRATTLVSRPGFNLSRVFHVFNRMLIQIYWGMELDRLGRPDVAREHFSAALELSRAAAPLPRTNTRAWELRLRARVGLCRAMIGDAEAAVADLEPTVETMGRYNLDEEAMARIGLVRAYAELGWTERAAAESDRAALAADKIKDPQLVLGAVWEQVRLVTTSDESPTAVVADYARRLEAERWEERERFVRETRDRLESERERRAARKMSAEYLNDPLTGLANRRHLHLRLREMVSRAHALDEVLTLAFVALDQTTPPQTLIDVGKRLHDVAGPHGFVARYGGNELVLVTPVLSGRDAAALIRSSVDGAATAPTVGIASVEGPPSVAGLVAAADEALLAARRSGGGVRLSSG